MAEASCGFVYVARATKSFAFSCAVGKKFFQIAGSILDTEVALRRCCVQMSAAE
jgi:hypothetical protein